MTHGHEVLHMMEGNSYDSKENLVEAIIDKFGKEELFYTCSAEGLNAGELIDFLDKRSKFKTSQDGSFTVNEDEICNH